MMPDLIELLESFNRKERHFLVAQALGGFQLSDQFRAKLGKAVGVEIPAGAFAAMDYHLDWLAAALQAYEKGSVSGRFDNQSREITGSQEDVDLLVGFSIEETIHLILLEAKGDTAWTNGQISSKCDRLKVIFGEDGLRYPQVKPHFCLTSPDPPSRRLSTRGRPAWMLEGDKYRWMKLHFPKETRRVIRCNSDCKESKDGDFFKIE